MYLFSVACVVFVELLTRPRHQGRNPDELSVSKDYCKIKTTNVPLLHNHHHDFPYTTERDLISFSLSIWSHL